MEAIDMTRDTTNSLAVEPSNPGWGTVARDVLVFQFKLVVDGLKDLFLAQVAVGAALLDLIRRDGSPGRRFYGIVRLSDRFDHWLDLHEPVDRAPEDTPSYGPAAGHSVDDLIDGFETGARVVAERSLEVSSRGVDVVRQRVERSPRAASDGVVAGMSRGREAFDRA